MSRQESSGGFCSEHSRGTYPRTLLEPPPRRLPAEESRSRMAVTVAVVRWRKGRGQTISGGGDEQLEVLYRCSQPSPVSSRPCTTILSSATSTSMAPEECLQRLQNRIEVPYDSQNREHQV